VGAQQSPRLGARHVRVFGHRSWFDTQGRTGLFCGWRWLATHSREGQEETPQEVKVGVLLAARP